MLIKGMTTQEIRVLQEFRRLTSETLTATAIEAIRHPVRAADSPTASLITKGYLVADPAADGYSLTTRAKDFLAVDARPMVEGSSAEEVEIPE